MTEIKFDKRNYRKHSSKNKELIKKSLSECGAGRSILIDNDGEIIAGNGIYEQAQKLGVKTKIIETDGSELVVVKRTDLNTGDEKRKQLAIMDNSTSDLSEFDLDLLQTDFDIPDLQEFGIDIKMKAEDDDVYTSRINIPQYEVKNESVTLKDCLDKNKAQSLIDEIQKSNVTAEEKEFLINAAYRHLCFNYRNVAEYYAKADKKMQELMEKSALVIIDYEDALKNGYTKLADTIENLKEADEEC